ncbi:DNA processing protein DprA [Spirochaetota bacterium]|nr:DNA processing protein DprA [Spirochaetota bacterium]
MVHSSFTAEEQSVLACYLAQSFTPHRLFRYIRNFTEFTKSSHSLTEATTTFSWCDLLQLSEYELKRRNLVRPNHRYEGRQHLLTQAKIEYQTAIKHKVQIITYASQAYPQILKKIPLPPLVLYCKGAMPRLDYERDHVVAIVGSRKSEAFINDFVTRFAKAIVTAGGIVVSGLALGVDGSAHLGALQGASKQKIQSQSPPPTIAVVASGVDYIYPYANRNIYDDILKHNGCILSEYPLGTKPLGYHFPLRNRIIAGLAREVFVAQAGIKSGALITAQYALDYGRSIYTYGVETIDPLPESYAGNLKLVKEGAHAVRLIDTFLTHTGFKHPNNALTPDHITDPYTTPQALTNKQLSESATRPTIIPTAPNKQHDETTLTENILLLLKDFPASLQELAEQLGVKPTLLTPLLMELVLDNKIHEVTPNRYMLKK